MKRLSLSISLYLAAGLLWLVAFAVIDSSVRWMALFCAVVFLSIGLWRLGAKGASGKKW